MTVLDWIIVGVVALTALSGYRRGLIVTAFSLIGTLIVSLLLRLAVDVARNLRSLRYS